MSPSSDLVRAGQLVFGVERPAPARPARRVASTYRVRSAPDAPERYYSSLVVPNDQPSGRSAGRPVRRRHERRACHRPVGTSGSSRTAPTRGDPWRGSLAPGEALGRETVADATNRTRCYSLERDLPHPRRGACLSGGRPLSTDVRRRRRTLRAERRTFADIPPSDLGRPRGVEPVGDAVLRLGLPARVVGRVRRERPRGDARARPGRRAGAARTRSRSSRSCTATRSSRATR